MKVINSW